MKVEPASWLESRYGSDIALLNQFIAEPSPLECELAKRGFPLLRAQFEYSRYYEYVVKVEDFTRRRHSLHLIYPDLIHQIEKELNPREQVFLKK
jgi:glycerol-3-phosphate dehydrogenase